MGLCVLRVCVEGGGGLHGHFREVGLPVGIQECLDRLTEDASVCYEMGPPEW